MGRIVVWVVLAAVLAMVFLKRDPLAADPTLAPGEVAVYGRSSCGYTKQMVAALERAGIAHVFRSVDDAATADLLHERMQLAGIDIRRYLLPVVEVGRVLEVRPAVAEVIRRAEREALTSP
jgi:glutaredoxin